MEQSSNLEKLNKIEKYSEFAAAFAAMTEDVHQNAVDHGWWEEDRNDAECLMLMVTELAEACEALRQGNPRDKHTPHFFSIETELADVIIRIMDFAGARGLSVGDALVAKHVYNRSREYKHGGKKF